MAKVSSRRGFLQAGGVTVGLGAGLLSNVLAGPDADQPLRVGLIGVGNRGTALLHEVLKIKNVRIEVICDLLPEHRLRAQELAEQAQGHRPEAFGQGPYDYRDLLARDDLHCAIIATPCYWHTTMYCDSLNAGMHFYGEKPFAITARGVKQILAAAEKNPHVVVQIGFQWGAHPGRKELIRRVRDGAIGELVEGRFTRHNAWRPPRPPPRTWINQRAKSGDFMLEQAVHEFNLIWWVVQEHPQRAYATGRPGVVAPHGPKYDVTDLYTAILEYPNGLTVHYTHGCISPQGYTGLTTRFIGTKGAIDVLGNSIQPLEPKPAISLQGGGDTREHLENFFVAVRAGKPQMLNCGLANGAAASYVGLMIRKSLDEKRIVTFDEMIQDPSPLPSLPQQPA